MEGVKADFAKSNPQLMESIHEVFESQRQEYLMYSSMHESNYHYKDSYLESFPESPTLLGKGDGHSEQDALKDSVHPDMLTESRPMLIDSNCDSHQTGYTSCIAEDTNLPIKQPLNQINIKFTLGKFITTILGSEEPLQDT